MAARVMHNVSFLTVRNDVELEICSSFVINFNSGGYFQGAMCWILAMGLADLGSIPDLHCSKV